MFRLELKRWRTCVAAVAAILAVAATGAAQDAPLPAPAAIGGGGGWKADARAAKASQRWQLEVVRSPDGAIRGRIRVQDSPLLRDGNVEGRVSGRDVSGAILDDGGNVVATFEGTVSGETMSGRYRDRSGEVGAWSWDGSAP